jgi:citrate lyase synthetase
LVEISFLFSLSQDYEIENALRMVDFLFLFLSECDPTRIHNTQRVKNKFTAKW